MDNLLIKNRIEKIKSKLKTTDEQTLDTLKRTANFSGNPDYNIDLGLNDEFIEMNWGNGNFDQFGKFNKT